MLKITKVTSFLLYYIYNLNYTFRVKIYKIFVMFVTITQKITLNICEDTFKITNTLLFL